eukprot:Em0017g632a
MQVQLLCIPAGYKNLSWLSGVERIQAHSLFKEEPFSVAGVDIDVADTPDDQPEVQSTGKAKEISQIPKGRIYQLAFE